VPILRGCRLDVTGTSCGSPAGRYTERVDDDIVGRQTDRLHVTIELLRRVELHQRQVAVARLLVVPVVYDDLLDGHLPLSALRLSLVVVAHHHTELRCRPSTFTSIKNHQLHLTL